MNKRLVFFSIILALVLGANQVQGQSCTEKLEEAQIRYDEGRIEEIGPLIIPCLNQGSFDRQQRQQAMKLITLLYLLEEEIESADSSMFQLIKKQHEFEPDYQLDPVEFINLYKSYRTWPIFSIGIKGGANYSFVDVRQLNTTGQAGDEREFSPTFATQLSIVFEKDLGKGFILAPQLDYSTKRVQYEESFNNLPESGNEQTVYDGRITFNQIELPLLVQYEILQKNLRPYVFGGITTSYLIKASMESSGNFNQLSRPNASPITLRPPADSNVTNDFVAWTFYGSIGAGLKIKAFEGYVTLESRYNYPISTLSPGNVPEEQDILWRLKAPHNEYKLHYATITLGYTLNIYKPKKL